MNISNAINGMGKFKQINNYVLRLSILSISCLKSRGELGQSIPADADPDSTTPSEGVAPQLPHNPSFYALIDNESAILSDIVTFLLQK